MIPVRPRRSMFFLRIAGALALLAAAVAPVRAEPVPVVATFSVLGDMVKQIGDDRVAVTTLVGPDGDTHVYRPSPADARAVARARLMVVNGLGFEGWMERLLAAADFKGVLVTASDGVDVIETGEDEGHHGDAHKDSHGHEESEKHGHDEHAHDKANKATGHDHDEKAGEHGHAEHRGHEEDGHHGHDHGAHDPHAWQDLASARVYARNIAKGLAAVDPANAAHYQERLTRYLKAISTLDAEIKTAMAQLPASRRTVVTSHDAFQYFGRAYGLTFLAPQGLSTESEASAEDVARLIRQIRAEKIKAVFVENLSDPRLVKRIAEETGAVVGGTLYPGALSPPGGPAPTYLDMLRTNARVLRNTLAD